MSGAVPQKDVKLLLGLAMNVCAFPQCGQRLVIDGQGTDGPAVIGEMAHIKGERRGASRFDNRLPARLRNRYGNLIFLCPNHHTEIDRLVDTYTVDVLLEMKRTHEAAMKKRLVSAMTQVQFSELDIAIKAILSNAADDDTDLTLTTPTAKLRKNGLSPNVGFLVRTGLSQAHQVRVFLEGVAVGDPGIPARLRAGFTQKYQALREVGLRGDVLFYELADFAAMHSTDLAQKAAGLAVLAYLFESCDVFER